MPTTKSPATVTVTLPHGATVEHTSTRTVTHALAVQRPGEDSYGVLSWHGSAAAARAGRSMARRCGYNADTALVVPID